MAERVLSIEMGSTLTKVCEMDYGSKNPKIYSSFVVSTPEGVLKDGIVDSDDEFVNTFLRMMTVKRIKTRKAIFTISSSKIATREARIPYCKESKIKEVVRANLADYFPIDGSQFMFSHSVIGLEFEQSIETKEETKAIESTQPMSKAEQVKAELEAGNAKSSGGKKGKPVGYKVLLLAAPKQLIQSYEKLAQNIGLQIVALDYNGNSVFQAAKEECRKGVQLIAKIDERGTLLMVVEEGAITLNRTIPYGIDDAIRALMGTYGLGDVNSYEKAIETSRKINVLMPSFDDCDFDNPSSEIVDKSNITSTLKQLVGGIIRVLDYYNANHSKNPVEKMLVTGIGADLQGLDTLITSEIGLKVREITHVAGVDISRLFKGAGFSEYIGCIGAGIAPINFYPESAEDEVANKETTVSASTLAYIVLGAGIVASIVMIVAAMIPYNQETTKNVEYKATIEELQPVYDMYLDYLELQNDVKYVETLDAASNNRNSEIVELLGMLENNMPATFKANYMTFNKEGVVIDATVGSKEEVAVAINQLKQIPLFIRTDVSAVVQEIDENNEITYSFTAEMMYAPYVTETEETAEQEVTE